jgi:hypothetical protein
VPVYFGDEADDQELLKKVNRHCKHISKSGFFKQLAADYFEREENKSTNGLNQNVTNVPPDLFDL